MYVSFPSATILQMMLSFTYVAHVLTLPLTSFLYRHSPPYCVRRVFNTSSWERHQCPPLPRPRQYLSSHRRKFPLMVISHRTLETWRFGRVKLVMVALVCHKVLGFIRSGRDRLHTDGGFPRAAQHAHRLPANTRDTSIHCEPCCCRKTSVIIRIAGTNGRREVKEYPLYEKMKLSFAFFFFYCLLHISVSLCFCVST